jgi:hypothetical protein
MRMATIFIPVLTTALLLSATETMAQEEIYRWVDKDGVVHFGNQPGEQADAELVEIQTPPANSTQTNSEPESAEPGHSQPTYAQQQRDERATNKKEAAERKEMVDHLCEQTRQVVARLEPMPRVMVTKEDGTTIRMDDNDRLEKLGEAKQFIAENCDN